MRVGFGPREGSRSPCVAAAAEEQPRRRSGGSGAFRFGDWEDLDRRGRGAETPEQCRLVMEEPFLSAAGFLFVPSCVSNSAQGCHSHSACKEAQGFTLFRFSLISLWCRGWCGVCGEASLGSPERWSASLEWLEIPRFSAPSSFLGEICKAGVIKSLCVSFPSLWLGRAGGIAESEERGCPGRIAGGTRDLESAVRQGPCAGGSGGGAGRQ